MKHGPGVHYFDDGDIFRGRYENDVMVGDFEVEVTFPNKDRYSGSWRDGKMHGKGVLECANGDRYEAPI